MNEDNDNVLNDLKETDQGKIDKKSARKMVWRTRLSIGFTVIRTLLLIFLLYLLYIIPVSMYYDMSGKQAGFDRLVTTLVETRYPGVEVEETGGHNAEINPFLTQSTTIKLYRNVGKWDVVVGEAEAQKRLFGDVKLTLNFDDKYLNENHVYNFAVPPGLLGQDNTGSDGVSSGGLKNQLAKIDDGHVAQVQFSLKNAMEPEALLEKLAAYDVQVTQMPVYGGELTEFNVSHLGSGQLKFVETLLLRPGTVYNSDNRHSSSVSLITDDTIDESIERFQQNLSWLIENGNYDDKDIDQARLRYIRENGVQVYGAVVTGPIREVEQLMDEEQFYQFHLGGIEVWNWYDN